jgi:hypothetical protein
LIGRQHDPFPVAQGADGDDPVFSQDAERLEELPFL